MGKAATGGRELVSCSPLSAQPLDEKNNIRQGLEGGDLRQQILPVPLRVLRRSGG